MNKDIEKKFISDFILKEYAERLFFELSGKKAKSFGAVRARCGANIRYALRFKTKFRR